MAPSALIGEVANVEITAVGSNSLFGSLKAQPNRANDAARLATQRA
jgi:hypothetical protein